MKFKVLGKIEADNKLSLPLYSAVSAGFPSPAEDYLDKKIDLNEVLVRHKEATFFVQVDGTSMQDAHIFDGDILIVDKSLQPQNNNIIIAVIDGEFTVKRISIKKDCVYLWGKPVVVLSNNDGCIIAANKEAKSLDDMPLFKPAFKIKNILEKHQINVFSSNYALYGDMSQKVMNILSEFTPHLEVSSIDEAFLDLQGFDFEDYELYGIKMRNTIKQYTGLPVGVGIASTKTLSKVANRIAKKFPKELNYVYVIDTEAKRLKALKWLDINDVWGIGRAHTKRLNKMGVYNAYQFTQLRDDWVKKHMTVVGWKLKKELEGEPCIELEEVQSPKKAIGTAKSFGKKLSDYSLISEALAYYVSEVAYKLRKQKSVAQYMLVFIHTNQFSKADSQYYKNVVITLPQATHSTLELTKQAEKGLKLIFQQGHKYKKVGVLLTGLIPETHIQQNLFYSIDQKKHDKILKSVDYLNNIYELSKKTNNFKTLYTV